MRHKILESKIVDFINFYILFLFYFDFLDLRLGVSMMSHNCHMMWYSVTQLHVIQKNIEDSRIIISLLWSQNLKVSQEKESCIRFIQENSIESSVQDFLPYIPQTTGRYTILAYSKWSYVCFKAIIYIIHSITLFLLESSTIFYYGMWSYDSVTCDIPLISNSSSKNKNKKKRKEERSK